MKVYIFPDKLGARRKAMTSLEKQRSDEEYERICLDAEMDLQSPLGGCLRSARADDALYTIGGSIAATAVIVVCLSAGRPGIAYHSSRNMSAFHTLENSR